MMLTQPAFDSVTRIFAFAPDLNTIRESPLRGCQCAYDRTAFTSTACLVRWHRLIGAPRFLRALLLLLAPVASKLPGERRGASSVMSGGASALAAQGRMAAASRTPATDSVQ